MFVKITKKRKESLSPTEIIYTPKNLFFDYNNSFEVIASYILIADKERIQNAPSKHTCAVKDNIKTSCQITGPPLQGVV